MKTQRSRRLPRRLGFNGGRAIPRSMLAACITVGGLLSPAVGGVPAAATQLTTHPLGTGGGSSGGGGHNGHVFGGNGDGRVGRRSAWWRPEGCGGDQACQNATLRSLRERFGAWNVFSPTVARLYNGSAALDLAPMTDDVIAAIAVARDVGYRVVPILEVDCGKVVGNANSSADFAPAISALLSLAARHDLDLDGFTLDMICGDLRRAQNTTTRRFVEFVDGLMAGLTVRDPDAEVNWFAHGGYHPDAASPNSARACFSEDTYRCERISWTMEGVRGWVELLKGQAGIGLEPSSTVYFESAALHTLFSSLLKLGVASIGTWGSFEKNDFKEEWAMAMRQYLLGNYSHFLSPPPVRAP